MRSKRENIVKSRRGVPCAAYYGDVITWNDIDSYFDDTFYSAMEVWQLTKTWGMANGSLGWGNEPRDYIEAITTLESESIKVENENMKKSMEKSNPSSKGNAKP